MIGTITTNLTEDLTKSNYEELIRNIESIEFDEVFKVIEMMRKEFQIILPTLRYGFYILI